MEYRCCNEVRDLTTGELIETGWGCCGMALTRADAVAMSQMAPDWGDAIRGAYIDLVLILPFLIGAVAALLILGYYSVRFTRWFWRLFTAKT